MLDSYAGVGSRDIPSNIELLMMKLGKHLCDLGFVLNSGDATGSDRAFYEGAIRSNDFTGKAVNIFLAWNGIFGRYQDPHRGFYNAAGFDNWRIANKIAEVARGSFEGLGRGGIALHSRNPYQILGHDLRSPVWFVLCYAKPIGTKGNVKGGTNTAVAIARIEKIPVINLYTEEGMNLAKQLLTSSSKVEISEILGMETRTMVSRLEKFWGEGDFKLDPEDIRKDPMFASWAFRLHFGLLNDEDFAKNLRQLTSLEIEHTWRTAPSEKMSMYVNLEGQWVFVAVLPNERAQHIEQLYQSLSEE